MSADHEVLACPDCGGGVAPSGAGEVMLCQACDGEYLVEGNVPRMFLKEEPHDSRNNVTDSVKEFYEEHPFPNYEELEQASDLIRKSEEGFYAKFLNDQIPFNARVLEVGCGTGQLSNYLGLASRSVIGTDICLNSLSLAEGFRASNNIGNVRFYQMNLFKPIFNPASFHLLICQGVLHHTGDPYLGFQRLVPLVKDNGYIIVGLYNKYGRLITDLRRLVFKLLRDRFKFLDPRLRSTDRGKLKRDAWFNDQYKHPHESKHTIGEVLRWFDENGIEFVNSIPHPKPFSPITKEEKLFRSTPRGNFMQHLAVQLFSIINGYREGGLFIMVGKKRPNA